jgi:hypothetical protein
VEEARWERWSAFGALGFVVLSIVIAMLPGSFPKPSDSQAKIAKFLFDNSKELRWTAFVGAIATVLLFWWVGAVWRMLRRAEGGSPRLAVVALAGIVTAGALLAAGSAVMSATAMAILQGGGGVHDPKLLFLLQGVLIALAGVGAALFVAACSIVFVRTHVMPAGLGWFGGLVALVLVVGGAGAASTKDVYFYFGFAGLVGLLLWVVITAILMLRAPAPADVAPADVASAT